MRARRLFSILIVLSLLLSMALAPTAALAEMTLFDVRIEYMDPNNPGAGPLHAMSGLNFTYEITNEMPPRLWIHNTSGFPAQNVRVVLVFSDGLQTAEYAFFDEAYQNEWFDLSASEAMPNVYSLVGESGIVPGGMLTLSESPMPAELKPAGPAAGFTVPSFGGVDQDSDQGYTDPWVGDQGGDQGNNQIGDQGGDQGYTDPWVGDQGGDQGDGQEYADPWADTQEEAGQPGEQSFGDLNANEPPMQNNASAGILSLPEVQADQTLPPQEARSDYGRVIGEGIQLYTQPYVPSNVTLLANDMVVFDGMTMQLDAEGRLWCYVTVLRTGETGYLMLDAFTFMTPQDKLLFEQSLEQMPSPETNQAKAKAEGVGVYALPGDPQPIQILGSENRITLVYDDPAASMRYDGDGRLWVLVSAEVNGEPYRGYMRYQDVDVLTQAEVDARDNPEPEPPEMETMPNPETDQANVVVDGALLTSLPGGGNTLRLINAGTRVTFLQSDPYAMQNDPTNGKLYVYVQEPGGVKGYLYYKDVQFMTQAEVEDAKVKLPERETNTLRILADGVAAKSSVNGADLFPVARGEYVSFLHNDSSASQNASDGSLWLYVEYNGQRGFLKYDAAQAAFLTKAEEDALKPPPTPMPDHETDRLLVRAAGGVSLYAQAGGQTVALTAPKDAVLDYQVSDSRPYQNLPDGSLWLYVSYNGQKGYLKYDAAQASFLTKAEEQQLFPPEKETMPPPESDVLRVLSDSLTLYQAAGSQTAVTTVAKDTYLTYHAGDSHAQQHTQDGKLWLYVGVYGKNGYVQYNTSAMRFLSAQEAELYKNPQTTFAPGTTGYAMVTKNDVQVRSSPAGSVSDKVNATAVVKITELKTASDGYQYAFVEYTAAGGATKNGWIRSDMMRLMTPDEINQYLNPVTPPPPTSTPTQVTGFMKTNVPYVPLLAWPNIGASPVAILPNAGTVVYVQQQEFGQDKNTWCFVNYNGSLGYILYNYLTPMTTAEVNKYLNDSKAPVPTPAPTYSPNAFSGYALLVKNSVNFRSGASGSASVLRQLKQGTIVRVINEVSAEGYTWYQCESGGVTGYLRGDMISPLTVGQYQTIVSSQSYDQNGNIITPTATAKASIAPATWAPPGGSSNPITFITIPPLVSASPSPTPDPSASPTVDPLASPTGTDGALGSLTPSPDPLATLPPPVEPTYPTQETSSFSPPGLLLALVVLLVIVAGGLYGYSVYNKARRKQAQEQAKRLADEARKKAQQAQIASGAQPAVRRPVPPTQPGAPGTPGTPGAQTPRPLANPYARPQGQGAQPQKPRVQDVTSPLPRAQVDGKPVDGTKPAAQSPQANPYARPQGAQPSRPQGAQPVQTPQRAEGPQKPSGTQIPPADTAARERARMPIAPPPVPPDEGPTPRRRRHRPDASKHEEA